MPQRILIFLLLVVCAAAQDKSAETGTISGIVVNANTGVPLNRVELALVGSKPVVTLTDANGKFEFVELNPGQYHLKGRRNGYLETYYGTRDRRGTGFPITVGPGQTVDSL